MLEQIGARQIGSGHFSKVFRLTVSVLDPKAPKAIGFTDFRMIADLKPWELMPPTFRSPAAKREERIVKVCVRPDRGALVVAKAAMATQDIDPLAPKYYGVTEFADGGWVAELEPLSECYSVPGGDAVHPGITGSNYSSAPTAEVIAASPFLSVLNAHIKSEYDAHELTGYRWDLHGANVMMRGSQPVVTDPICHRQDVELRRIV